MDNMGIHLQAFKEMAQRYFNADKETATCAFIFYISAISDTQPLNDDDIKWAKSIASKGDWP